MESDTASSAQPKVITIIGGAGGMGRLFRRELEAAGHEVRVLDKDDWHRWEPLLADVDLVLLSVPIEHVMEGIEQLAGKLGRDQLLADVTSIKVKPIRKMREVHAGPVLGLHPMFGPTTKRLQGQLIVDCGGRRPHAFAWFLETLRGLGAKMIKASADEHDRMMAFVQVARHFASFAYGVHLFEENADLDRMMAFSSPIYRLEMGMVGRLFAQDPHLYAEIIFSSEVGKQQLRHYHNHLGEMVELVERGDKDAFIDYFKNVSAWYGELGRQFLDESSYIIDKLTEYTREPAAEEVSS
ncbi:bifunctional chorismate mutase/prephenate dehydrogenase [Sulfidibacter corallicola]|uniref:Bifunctional chorismate mutase/prephenate dehydrogenase n=1 Tax=Sulfidibacter corallicola TaxID=2818388 RepID=A0A8A4TL31_SULCO|nr:bifunctional chorismate mutase/prephenate dehydrogenase [Sulfidibacter corallicola]QTD50666.1 bifunctional chorismate mutase/prephenate dehydrogenase [Sulfidibacter corallicola]